MSELPDRRILSEAAQWFALLNSSQASDADVRRWRAWLGAHGSPQAQAWQRVQALSDQFGMAREPAARSALQSALGRRRQVLRSMLLLAGASAGTWATLNSRAWRGWTADYHSGVGELQQIALPDGTQLWINTDSAIRLHYTAALREVQLVHGEIHIVTASPAGETRPFVVTTRAGSARALGTRYTVLAQDGRTTVSVYEGAVALQPAGSQQEPWVIPAGEQAVMTPATVLRTGAAGAMQREWTRGLLLANDVPLGEFIQELSRYRRGHIACAPEVAGLRLVGSFPALDTDVALDMIARSLPVVIRRRSPWWVTVAPR